MCADLLKILPLALLAGCGSLVGLDYRGEALLTLEGQVLSDGSVPLDGQIGVALLWSLDLQPEASQQAVVAQTRFPSRYSLQLYHPPTVAASQPLLGQPWLQAIVGQPILYEDLDSDGLWDQSQERVVGGAFDRAIVWVEALGARPEGLSGWSPEGAGFHVVEVLRQPCIDPDALDIGLSPLVEQRTDLEVGYYYQASFDWDCDGDQDWDPGTEPLGECADHEAYRAQCEQYEIAAVDPELARLYLDQLLDDPVLEHCLDEICPYVIEALQIAAESACPEPHDLQETCEHYRVVASDPELAEAERQALQSDPRLEGCLREACPEAVDALYGIGDPNDPGDPTDPSCPPPVEMEQLCQQIGDEASDPQLGPAHLEALLQDPQLHDCLLGYCPAVIGHLFSEPWP